MFLELLYTIIELNNVDHSTQFTSACNIKTNDNNCSEIARIQFYVKWSGSGEINKIDNGGIIKVCIFINCRNRFTFIINYFEIFKNNRRMSGSVQCKINDSNTEIKIRLRPLSTENFKCLRHWGVDKMNCTFDTNKMDVFGNFSYDVQINNNIRKRKYYYLN